jgi:hypothetical protein
VTYQNGGMTFVNDLLHAIETFLLEHGIPDREHLVENHNFRIQMSGNRKR